MILWRTLVVTGFLLSLGTVSAEPWFAIETGSKCVACHISPTGGGKRTVYGAMWPQTVLSRKTPTQFWDGSVSDRLSFGADIRANVTSTRIPEQDNRFAFDTEEALVYAKFDLIPNKLFFYLDERVAPGGASSREAYAFYWLNNNKTYIRAGRIFLPFGWRLEDDSAFIRQVPGINYNTPDDGLEIGYESAKLSTQLAITNGTAGGGEADTGKQLSFRSSFIQPKWRAGFSANLNNADGGDRTMYGVFVGAKTGPVNWLFEADRIEDESFPGGRDLDVALIEANWLVSKGINVKATHEYFNPDGDIDEDEQSRTSLVLEYFPMQFLQLSLGGRVRDGIPQSSVQNTDEFFLQLHAYF